MVSLRWVFFVSYWHFFKFKNLFSDFKCFLKTQLKQFFGRAAGSGAFREGFWESKPPPFWDFFFNLGFLKKKVPNFQSPSLEKFLGTLCWCLISNDFDVLKWCLLNNGILRPPSPLPYKDITQLQPHFLSLILI